MCRAAVQYGRPSACCSGDEWGRRVGKGDHQCGVRAIVVIYSVVEVVHSEMASIIEVYVEFSGQIPPELGQVRRNYDEEVGTTLDEAVETLRTQVGWESYRAAVNQLEDSLTSGRCALFVVGANKTRCSNAAVSWSRTAPCASIGDLNDRS